MAKKKKNQARQRKQPNDFLKYSGLGLQMLITIGVATFAGIWLDGKTGWKFPLFTLVFLMGSFAGTLYKLYKDLS